MHRFHDVAGAGSDSPMRTGSGFIMSRMTLPSAMNSGLPSRSTVWPTMRPDALSSAGLISRSCERHHRARHSHDVVILRSTKPASMPSIASTTKRTENVPFAVLGVGTTMNDASASAAASAKSVVARRRDRLRSVSSASPGSLDSRSALVQQLDNTGPRVHACHVVTASREDGGERCAELSEADDANSHATLPIIRRVGTCSSEPRRRFNRVRGRCRAFYTSEEVCSRKGRDLRTPVELHRTLEPARAGEATAWSPPSRTNRSLSCAAETVVRAFFNVCRHRGTRLCTAETGRFGDVIQCPCAWTYAIEGDLIGAPHMHGVDGFNRDDYPLHTAAVAESNGFVFVDVATSTTPFAP